MNDQKSQAKPDLNDQLPEVTETPDYWRLLRDVLVFQFKLVMDGVRDVILSPVSIVVVLFGFVSHRENPDRYFKRLLIFGRRTDLWINLFGSSNHQPSVSDTVQSSDAYIKKLEDLLIIEYNKGGLVKGLKDGTDDLISRIRNDSDRAD